MEICLLRRALNRSDMSGCLDRLSCDCDCDCLEPVKEWLRPKRNIIASVISGTLVRDLVALHLSVKLSNHHFSFFPVFSGLVACD